MKKLFILSLVITLGSVACNSNGTNTGEPANNVVSEANPISKVEEGTVVKLNKAKFQELVWNYDESPKEWVYKGDKPAIIDFYATWCGPCKITSPILDELAKEYKDQIVIYKIDVDAERELASVFGIQSMPTFLYIPKDKQPSMASGIARSVDETKAMFKSQIDEVLLNL